mmetsp:Transcript_38759/g.93013  ORF Transcript_38759/g.93013 Transcript_38759/m.93013 type:complete len:242 (+) Transcript_38759:798-1523(+)
MPTMASATFTRRSRRCQRKSGRPLRPTSWPPMRSAGKWRLLTPPGASPTFMCPATSSLTTRCQRQSVPVATCGMQMARRQTSKPPFLIAATALFSVRWSSFARNTVRLILRPWVHARMSASWHRRPRSMDRIPPRLKPSRTVSSVSWSMILTGSSWVTVYRLETSGAHASQKMHPSRIGSSWQLTGAAPTTSRTMASLQKPSSGWTHVAHMMRSSCRRSRHTCRTMTLLAWTWKSCHQLKR